MSTYVLDTSVTVAWYFDEAFSVAARTWQDRLLSGKARFIVPSLHYWEFANVLRTLVMRGEISRELALETYALHLDAPLDVEEPERRAVLRTALEFGATAYDAAYIALATLHNVHLITAERTTTAWVTKLGRRIEAVR